MARLHAIGSAAHHDEGGMNMLDFTRRSAMVIVFVATCLGAYQEAHGAPDDQDMIFFGLSLGWGTNDVAFGASLGYIQEPHIITLQFVYNLEFLALFTSPKETVWDVGLLYGRVERESYGFIAASGGLSLVGGVKRGEFINSSCFDSKHEKRTFLTMGIPIRLQASWIPVEKFLGVGISAAADLNLSQPFAAGLLDMQFGEME